MNHFTESCCGGGWSFSEPSFSRENQGFGASRTFSGIIDGDVSDQLRQRIRTALRKATNYDQDPLLFVLQDDDIANEFMLWGRVTSGSKQDNVGWYWDEVNMTWKPIGSLKVTIDEVI